MTTGTVTSARLLAAHLRADRLPGFGEGRVLHRFVPLDVPAWAARFLDHWRPDAAAFVESELWPNLLAACRARHIPAMLVNARMSARSFRGWHRAPGFAREVLGSFTRVHPQSAADAERLRRLGATGLEPAGNLKLAAAPLSADPAALATLHQAIGARPVWLAASTHPGEEAVAAAVHHALAAAHPGLLDHHRTPPSGARRGTRRVVGCATPGRWRTAAAGRPLDCGHDGRAGPALPARPRGVRRPQPCGAGRSEPARARPARLRHCHGPYTDNFADTVARLSTAGALTVVPDQAGLAAWVGAMLTDPAARDAAGQAAIAAAHGEAALPARVAAALHAMLGA